MSVVLITTYNEDGTVARQERTSYKYGADGIRTSALHEIDADAVLVRRMSVSLKTQVEMPKAEQK